MSKLSHFGVGITLCVCSVICVIFGYIMFLATAVGKDASGGSIFDAEFIFVYIVFGSLVLGSLWGAFVSFRRVLRLTRKEIRETTKSAAFAPRPTDSGTPDEKLARLVKKKKDDDVA